VAGFRKGTIQVMSTPEEGIDIFIPLLLGGK